MNIIYKTGDLLTGPERFIVHGCNAQGVMGAGIAKQIREQFPQAFTAYRQAYEDQGNWLDLGQAIWVKCGPKTIINAITQEFYGRDPNKVYVSYKAVRKALKQINASTCLYQGTLSNRPFEAVGFPLIGAGLANGSWKTISAIIEEESTQFQPVVYLFDGRMPLN